MKPCRAAVAALVSLLASIPCSAIEIENTVCVPASIQKIQDSITDYAHYPALHGAALPVSEFARHLDVLTRKAFEFLTRDNHDPNAVVIHMDRVLTRQAGPNTRAWIELQAHSLKTGVALPDYALRPRFGLICSVQSDAASFVQRCEFDHTTNVAPFGLRDFNATLEASAGDCDPGKSQFHYHVVIQSNPAEVGLIRDALLKPYGALGALASPIASLFTDVFFQAYYSNFYQGWVDTISQ